MKPAMTPQQSLLTDAKRSPFALYKELVAKDSSFVEFLWQEFLTCALSGLPGILGLGARRLLYPSLFANCGKSPAFGKGVLLRNPKAISLGQKLLIDDYAVLDARGEGAALCLADRVSIGRFTTLAAKGGKISLAQAVNIGSYCRLATQSSLEIGESVLIAAYCYIGPGNHQRGDAQTPLIARDMEIKGGVRIEKHAWIGARSTILDGVTVGEGAIVGAHSLVRENVAPNTVVAGAPAKIIATH